MKYETREKENGDCEVWRHIPGSKMAAQHVATFHKIDASSHFAEDAALIFAKEQNHREEALKAFIKRCQEDV